MVKIEEREYPEHLFYDIGNQIWYEPLLDGTVRAGFTPVSMTFAGDILVFTPKRIGRTFEKGRSFATVEGGKWVGAAAAAFDGTVVAYNEGLMNRPKFLNEDPFGQGWMLIVRPANEMWRDGLVTGENILPAFNAWLASGVYKDRTD